MNFKFEIGANVAFKMGSERGQIIGRAEYETSENQYLIRYIAADGRLVENWWTESTLR